MFLRKPQAFYKCHGALLPRSFKPYHSSLRRRTFLGLEMLQELLPMVCVEGAREYDWTRGATPTHTPPTPRLVWLSSISLSGWVSNGSSHCSRCPTPPPPRPCVCVCVCVFIDLNMTAKSGPVILVSLCHSHRPSQEGINDTYYENR